MAVSISTSELPECAGLARTWTLGWTPGQGRAPQMRLSGAFGALVPESAISAAGNRVYFLGYLFETETTEALTGGNGAMGIASAYDRRGMDLVDRLRGGFLLVIWDRRLDRLFLARDAMGLVPCYYFDSPDSVLVSPSSSALVAQREVDSSLNREMLAEWLLGSTNPFQVEETFFQSVRRLPPAHWRALGERGVSPVRYWDPLAPGFHWLDSNEAKQISSHLSNATERCMGVGADSIALSGGYDSLVMAALAVQASERRRPLHALSLRFRGTELDEGELQRWAADYLGLTQTLRDVHNIPGDSDFVERVLEHSARSPMPVIGLWQPLYSWLMERAQAQGLKRVLFGTGGDEMFSVDTVLARDLILGGRPGQLWRFLRAWQRTSPFGGAHVARYIIWHASLRPMVRAAVLRGTGSLAPRLRASLGRSGPRGLIQSRALADVLEKRASVLSPAVDEPNLGHYVAVLRDLLQSPLLMIEMDQGAAWMAAYGVSALYPYLDRDLVGSVLRMRPESLYGTGYMKAPLREIAVQRLPGLPNNSKKVDFGRLAGQVIRSSGEGAWRALGGVGCLAELGVIDPAGADRFMNTYFHDGRGSTQFAWRLMSVESWLRAQGRIC